MNAKDQIPDEVVRKFCAQWERIIRECKPGKHHRLRNNGTIDSKCETLIKKYQGIYRP